MGEIKEFEGAIGHGGLNILNTRGSGVFACFGVIVVKIWGAARGVNCVSEERGVEKKPTGYLQGET